MTLLEFLEGDCPEDFSQCEVVFHSGWSDYEEAAFVVVFDFLGDLYVVEHYDSVMADCKFCFDPEPINLEQVEELKKVWNDEDNEPNL